MDMTNRNDLMGEITACKSLLNESDYQLMKMLESLTDCTTATGLIKVLASFRDEFKELVANRIKWRATVNECEKALDELAAETIDNMPDEPAPEIPEIPEAAVDSGTEAAAEEAPESETANTGDGATQDETTTEESVAETVEAAESE